MNNQWENMPLGEVLIERKERPSEEDLATGAVRIVSKIGFNDGTIQLREDSKTKTGMILIRPGDLVVSGINAAKGAIAIYNEENTDPIAATIHYGAYFPDVTKVDIKFLWWLLRSNTFRDILTHYVPGGIKTELKAKRLLPIPIPLPPLPEQKRTVAKIELLVAKIERVIGERKHLLKRMDAMLLSVFSELTDGTELRKMEDVAPIIRRPVEIDLESEYAELGIKSFGKGTFHKPVLNGFEAGSKRLYKILPEDLLFNNVFAWEGAVAVVRPDDNNRFGSHRFITCVAKKNEASAKFLRFYFLTNEGLRKVGEASPGGAGRNRTLGLKALMAIEVPLPPIKRQVWFESILDKVEEIQTIVREAERMLDSLSRSVLDKAFRGEL